MSLMKFFEIEQKYRLKDPKKVRGLLKKFRVKKISGGLESNEFFDRDWSLAKQKIALRLRRTGAKRSTLTLKGPRLAAKFTKRMEIETAVDYVAAKAILGLLGYRIVMKYHKTRETYRWGRAFVTLDYLKKFGWFLEIEAQPEEIARLARKLELRDQDREKRSYLHMLFSWKH